jgi:hypothetical protein
MIHFLFFLASSHAATDEKTSLAFEDDEGSCVISKNLTTLGLSPGCCVSDDCTTAAADRATAIETAVADLAAAVADMNVTMHYNIDVLAAANAANAAAL